jgi:hypothetical protein
MMIGGAIDEFLVLGADAPALRRLLSAREYRDQLIPRFDDGIMRPCLRSGAHSACPPLLLSKQIGMAGRSINWRAG